MVPSVAPVGKIPPSRVYPPMEPRKREGEPLEKGLDAQDVASAPVSLKRPNLGQTKATTSSGMCSPISFHSLLQWAIAY